MHHSVYKSTSRFIFPEGLLKKKSFLFFFCFHSSQVHFTAEHKLHCFVFYRTPFSHTSRHHIQVTQYITSITLVTRNSTIENSRPLSFVNFRQLLSKLRLNIYFFGNTLFEQKDQAILDMHLKMLGRGTYFLFV